VRRDRELAYNPVDRVRATWSRWIGVGSRPSGLKQVAECRVGLGRNISAVAVTNQSGRRDNKRPSVKVDCLKILSLNKNISYVLYS
jgi:hypothetical protein